MISAEGGGGGGVGHTESKQDLIPAGGRPTDLLILGSVGRSQSQVRQDSARTGRRASPRWPPPRSAAPSGSGSCGSAASAPRQGPGALRAAVQRCQGWRGPASTSLTPLECWSSNPDLGEGHSHLRKPAGGSRCTGSAAYLRKGNKSYR